VPLEYLTLHIEMPFMLLLSDMKQGIFYSMLLSFWLVFAGEHLMVINQKSFAFHFGFVTLKLETTFLIVQLTHDSFSRLLLNYFRLRYKPKNDALN
jgi:hypothetical protein